MLQDFFIFSHLQLLSAVFCAPLPPLLGHGFQSSLLALCISCISALASWRFSFMSSQPHKVPMSLSLGENPLMLGSTKQKENYSCTVMCSNLIVAHSLIF